MSREIKVEVNPDKTRVEIRIRSCATILSRSELALLTMEFMTLLDKMKREDDAA